MTEWVLTNLGTDLDRDLGGGYKLLFLENTKMERNMGGGGKAQAHYNILLNKLSKVNIINILSMYECLIFFVFFFCRFATISIYFRWITFESKIIIFGVGSHKI